MLLVLVPRPKLVCVAAAQNMSTTVSDLVAFIFDWFC